MSEPFVSAKTVLGLAQRLVPALTKKIGDVRKKRAEEWQRLVDVFGDPELLAPYYVEPACQLENPADADEDEPWHKMRVPVSKWLGEFLHGSFKENNQGRNVLFVLSDAGMGKTSLLTMLKLSHWTGYFPSGVDCKLLKLGDDTLDEIAEIQERHKTVLLLDALDEDQIAWNRLSQRLDELLHATKNFRQVILTCRTQFFPKGDKAPIPRPERVVFSGFVCNLIYLSPFNDDQVEHYLRLSYPDTPTERILNWLRKQENPRLAKARTVVQPMKSLRMRPMLLAHLDELMDDSVEVAEWTEFEVYRALVQSWLVREESKQEGDEITWEVLWEACREVAIWMQRHGRREISPEEMLKLLAEAPAAEKLKLIDVEGRSLLNKNSEEWFRFAHYSIQEFLVAEALTSSGGLGGEKIRATEQLFRFLDSWRRSGKGRRIPFEELDLSVLALKEKITSELFLWIPGGRFKMGGEVHSDEKPIHEVELSSFWLARTPVTNRQYALFLEQTDNRAPEYWSDSRFNAPDQPFVGVNWHEACAYCSWLSELSGQDVRLPTEAQWEYAARGPESREFPWGSAPPNTDLACFGQSWEEGRPSPVGAHPSGGGPFGTLDQAGNVWEWCLDGWSESAYADRRDGVRDPFNVGVDGEDAAKSVRGGCWGHSAGSLRAAYRGRYHASDRRDYLGFRICVVPANSDFEI